MQPAIKKAPLLFVTWQHLHMLTKQSETTCRLELSRYCTKYNKERITIYHLCEEFGLTREQLYFHLEQ